MDSQYETICVIEKSYDKISIQINKENQLIDTRVRWNLIFSGGVLAAIFSINKLSPLTEMRCLIEIILFIWIPLAGIAVAQFSLKGIQAAEAQIVVLKELYQKQECDFKYSNYGFPAPFANKDINNIAQHTAKATAHVSRLLYICIFLTYLVFKIIEYKELVIL